MLQDLPPPPGYGSRPPGCAALLKVAGLGLLTLSFVPLSNFLYWVPYWMRGLERYAYYDFGGYFMFWFIAPAYGIVAGLVFLGVRFGLRRNRFGLWIAYAAVLSAFAAVYLAFGLTDYIPDFGE